jgi:hypothetical protein
MTAVIRCQLTINGALFLLQRFQSPEHQAALRRWLIGINERNCRSQFSPRVAAIGRKPDQRIELIAAAEPPEQLQPYLGGGLVAMLLMMAVGIPIYVCATASVPIAAGFIHLGASPGAALAFHGLRRRHLMHEMTIDVEEARAVRLFVDNVVVPDLVVERTWFHDS